MRLTDMSVRSLPAPPKGQKTYWDESLNGFGCRVSQGGTRSFVLQFGADRQFVTIGRYHPDILPLGKARAEAKKILAEQVLGKHRAKSVRFEDAKDVFLAACRRKNKPRTVYDYTRLIERHFAFGRKHLADISPSDITHKLNAISADSQRDHAVTLIKIFFKWAYRQGYLDVSPADRLLKAKSSTRARVLSDAELRSIWRACELDTGAAQPALVTDDDAGRRPLPANYCTIVKLLMLTGQRRGEIAALRTSWLVGDAIELPKEITKNGLEHVVFLSSEASTLCSKAGKAATTATRENDTLLFPGPRKGGVFSAWSNAKVDLDRLSGVTGWTLHDLRRTFSTRLNAFTPPHVVEKIINHVSGTVSGVAAVYNRYEYTEERRAAVAEWERRLLAIVSADDNHAVPNIKLAA